MQREHASKDVLAWPRWRQRHGRQRLAHQIFDRAAQQRGTAAEASAGTCACSRRAAKSGDMQVWPDAINVIADARRCRQLRTDESCACIGAAGIGIATAVATAVAAAVATAITSSAGCLIVQCIVDVPWVDEATIQCIVAAVTVAIAVIVAVAAAAVAAVAAAARGGLQRCRALLILLQQRSSSNRRRRTFVHDDGGAASPSHCA